MRRIPARLILTPAALLLTACGGSDTEPGPGGVTVGEARALDEAAEMLDQQRLPADLLEEPEPEQAPEPAIPAAPPVE